MHPFGLDADSKLFSESLMCRSVTRNRRSLCCAQKIVEHDSDQTSYCLRDSVEVLVVTECAGVEQRQHEGTRHNAQDYRLANMAEKERSQKLPACMTLWEISHLGNLCHILYVV